MATEVRAGSVTQKHVRKKHGRNRFFTTGTSFHKKFEQRHKDKHGHTGDQDKHDLRGQPRPENAQRVAEGAKEVHQLGKLFKDHIDKLNKTVQDLAYRGLQKGDHAVSDCAEHLADLENTLDMNLDQLRHRLFDGRKHHEGKHAS